jgi:hypothetical protein
MKSCTLTQGFGRDNMSKVSGLSTRGTTTVDSVPTLCCCCHCAGIDSRYYIISTDLLQRVLVLLLLRLRLDSVRAYCTSGSHSQHMAHRSELLK